MAQEPVHNRDEAIVQQSPLFAAQDDILQADTVRSSVDNVEYHTGPEDVDDVIKSKMPMRSMMPMREMKRSPSARGVQTATPINTQSGLHRMSSWGEPCTTTTSSL